MHVTSSEPDGGAPAPSPPTAPTDHPEPVATEGFSAADYCHLAEECMFMAALAKDPETAAELLKAGDDYLRRAAQWIANQLKNK